MVCLLLGSEHLSDVSKPRNEIKIVMKKGPILSDEALLFSLLSLTGAKARQVLLLWRLSWWQPVRWAAPRLP